MQWCFLPDQLILTAGEASSPTTLGQSADCFQGHHIMLLTWTALWQKMTMLCAKFLLHLTTSIGGGFLGYRYKTMTKQVFNFILKFCPVRKKPMVSRIYGIIWMVTCMKFYLAIHVASTFLLVYRV